MVEYGHENGCSRRFVGTCLAKMMSVIACFRHLESDAFTFCPDEDMSSASFHRRQRKNHSARTDFGGSVDFRRAAPAMPNNPLPSSSNVLGSGTVVVLLPPLT